MVIVFPLVPLVGPDMEETTRSGNAGLIVMERVFGTEVLPLLSVNTTVKELLPVAVGMPLMIPDGEFRIKPAGRFPELIDH